MYAQVEKPKKNESKSIANSVAQNKGNTKQSFGFVDNRPVAVVQKNHQGIANNIPKTKQSAQLNTMVGNYSAQQQPIRTKENSTISPAQQKEHAYAQGIDIHLGPREGKNLPHEAWRVVQKKQGKVQPPLQIQSNSIVNVSDNTNLGEKEDVKRAKAAHVNMSEQCLGIAHPVAVSQHKSNVIQRLDYNQLSHTQGAQVRAVADGIYYQFSPEFEKAVGAAAFSHPDAVSAARNTANNFATILRAYAGTRVNQIGEGNLDKENRYLENYLGSQGRGPAGSISQESDQIRAALARGNLREQLTMMYNTVSGGAFGRIVKAILINVNAQQQLVNDIGLPNEQLFHQHLKNVAVHFNVNDAALANDDEFVPRADNTITYTRGTQQDQTRNLPPRYRPDGFDMYGDPMMVEINYSTFRPIPATRAIMADNVGGQTAAAVDSRVGRKGTNTKTEDSANDLANKGAALSNRELIHQYLSRDPAKRDRQIAKELYAADHAPNNNAVQAAMFWGATEDVQRLFLIQRFGSDGLAWEPGKRVFDLVPDAEFTEQMDRAKVLIKATGSSSTDLVMKMGRYMDGSGSAQIFGMRAAALGWMLPVGDHSYWEILLAASRHGTPAPVYGPDVYNEHGPMTRGQIGEDSPDLLMRKGFRNTLSHILFGDDTPQINAGLGVELHQQFPYSSANIKDKINTVARHFKPTPNDREVDLIVNAVQAPRVVVERITDILILQDLWRFISEKRIEKYTDMTTLRRDSGRYKLVKGKIGRNAADLIFASIFASVYKDHHPDLALDTTYLATVSHFLSGQDIDSPDTTLDFSDDKLNAAKKIPKRLNKNYGDYDRGKLLDYRPIANNLKGEELLALRDYTGSASHTWNKIVSNPRALLANIGTRELNKLEDDVQAGISGLQKLPVYNQGRVYRGENGKLGDYRVGDLVSFKKFLSTAKSYQDSFAPSSKVTIVIDNIRTGRDIQLLSHQDQEREVLFPPYARFVVTRVEDRRKAGGDYESIWVYMNEI